MHVDRAGQPAREEADVRKYDDGQWHSGHKVVEDASDVSVEHGRGRVVYGRHGGGRGSRNAVDDDEFGSDDDAELRYLWLQEQTF